MGLTVTFDHEVHPHCVMFKSCVECKVTIQPVDANVHLWLI